MTEKQMKAFLKKEGWKWKVVRSQGAEHWYWVDPVTDIHYMFPRPAFKTASRRKRERETRRLKAAGFWCLYGVWYDSLTDFETHNWSGSKAEALATLEKP